MLAAMPEPLSVLTEELPIGRAPGHRGSVRNPGFSGHVDAWLSTSTKHLYPFGSQVLIDAEARICRFIEDRFRDLPSSEAWRLQKDCLRESRREPSSGPSSRASPSIRKPYPSPSSTTSDVTSFGRRRPSLRTALARLPASASSSQQLAPNMRGRVPGTARPFSNEFHAVCDNPHRGFRRQNPCGPPYEKVVAKARRAILSKLRHV